MRIVYRVHYWEGVRERYLEGEREGEGGKERREEGRGQMRGRWSEFDLSTSQIYKSSNCPLISTLTLQTPGGVVERHTAEKVEDGRWELDVCDERVWRWEEWVIRWLRWKGGCNYMHPAHIHITNPACWRTMCHIKQNNLVFSWEDKIDISGSDLPVICC